ncbi:MAG: hypothetical protein IIB00_04065 [candidate division Zixibacteria bacterium]|nr:hypothetical protein [candidate division Zixibacteria bacterium]
MGHLRLWKLPKTHRWKEVVEQLELGSEIPQLAESSLRAAETGLYRAAKDDVLISTLLQAFLLFEAASKKSHKNLLSQLGYPVSADTSHFDFIIQFRKLVEESSSSYANRTDAGEIALNAFTEVLGKYLRAESGDLFDSRDSRVIERLSKASKGKQFQRLMRDFYASFTSRYLDYFIGRELSQHIGANERFRNLSEQESFSRDFELYVRQSIRIVDEFTPGWYGKTKFKGEFDHNSVRKYAHVAFKKIVSEFVRGGDLD